MFRSTPEPSCFAVISQRPSAMDVITLSSMALNAIVALINMRDEFVWNKEQCERLVSRIDGLKSPIEKIKNKESPDEGHQQLLDNIISTIKNATDFMIQFREKRAIFQILRRKDYKEDFKTFHEEVSQHVGDLNLSETVIVGEELQAAIKSAEKADEEHLQELLEGMMEQLNDNHHEQTTLMKEMQEGFGMKFKSVEDAI